MPKLRPAGRPEPPALPLRTWRALPANSLALQRLADNACHQTVEWLAQGQRSAPMPTEVWLSTLTLTLSLTLTGADADRGVALDPEPTPTPTLTLTLALTLTLTRILTLTRTRVRSRTRTFP